MGPLVHAEGKPFRGPHVPLFCSTKQARILIRTTVMVVEYGSYEYRVMDEGVPVDAVIHKR